MIRSTETINSLSQGKAETTVHLEAFDGMDQVYLIMDKGEKDAQGRQWDIQVENKSSYQVRDGKVQQVKETSLPIFDGSGETTAWIKTTYDQEGRQIRRNYPDGVWNETSYSANQVTSTNALGSSISSFDAWGNLVKKQDALNAITDYSYDATGRIESVLLPLGVR